MSNPIAAATARVNDAERELQAANDALILAALHACNGERRAAARLLGVSEQTVFRWLRAHPEAPPAPPTTGNLPGQRGA